MFLRSFAAAAIAVTSVFAITASSEARADDIDVILALPTTTLSYATPWIAEDAGFFKKNGLKVTVRQLTGVASNNAVISGSADFLLGTAGTFLNAASKGQRLLLIANMVDRPAQELVMRKDVAEALGITDKTPLIDRIKALKGKTVAVGGIGSATHAFQRLVAKKGGLDAETDMTVAVVDQPAMAAAMAAKRVDAFSNSPPYSTEAIVKYGAVVIASAPAGDLPEFIPTDQTALQVKPDTCQKTPDKCAKMAAAFQEAVDLIKSDPDKVWDIVKKHNEQMDPEILKAAWASIAKTHTQDLRITVEGLDKSQKFSLDAGLLDPKDVIKDYTGLYTDQFVKK